MTSNQLAELADTSPATLFNRAISSPTIHGVLLPDGTVLYHPEGAYKQISSRYKTKLKRVLELQKEILQVQKNQQLN
jgi:hypothetical protein